MNPLKSVENMISSLVEGTFGRLFRTEVRPIELARKLAREMDAHRTVSVSRVYVPNEYAVWLSPADRERYDGVEHEVIDELCAYLLEHARREDLIMASQPHISFHTDERLSLGEFGIQARLTRPPGEEPAPPGPVAPAPPASSAARPAPAPAPPAPAPAPPAPAPPAPMPPAPAPPVPAHPAPAAPPIERDQHGETMIYSSSARLRAPVEDAQARRVPQRALLAVGGRRLLVPSGGGTIGRSRDCDVVLDDAGISRRHAEIRPGPDGWTVADLGSTNGVRVNGAEVRGVQALAPGDRVELGSTEIVFEVS
jgi:predicted component of type VI protein secretion system